ncbi:Cytochrome P450 [Naviculisporaceae sp. PSN 640]
MGLILFTLLAWPTYRLIEWAWCLFWNYRAAKKSGFPVLISPFSPDLMPYMLLKVPLRNFLEKYIPLSGIRPSIFGWEMIDKTAVHDKYGETFILCTPDVNEVWVASPDLANIILSRRKEFPQSVATIKTLSVFGPNILTADGDSWARQRRLVVPNLNERIMSEVWDTTLRQASQMVNHMFERPGSQTEKTVEAVRSVAMNVLGEVGYGIARDFELRGLPRDPDAKMTYVDAVGLCGELILLSTNLSSKFLRRSFMPKLFKTLGVAMDKLPVLCNEMIEERRKAAHAEGIRENFMSMLIRLSDDAKMAAKRAEQDKEHGTGGLYLTEDEIMGNLFIFTVAGFDTTANTLGYAMGFLAAFPEWQAWIQEEIDFVLGQPGADIDDYASLFPKLPRCLAIMHEILRLLPAQPHLSRSLPTSGHSVNVHLPSGESHLFVGPVQVYINIVAMQYRESIWGPDAHDFRPSRWIADDEKKNNLGEENLFIPEKGSYLPFSGGPRICPGMKMAQVEFVSVMVGVFSKVSVEPVCMKIDKGNGAFEMETIEQARLRTYKVASETQQRITTQMANPDGIVLRWVKK